MREFKEDADSSWSRYHENQTLGRQLCNGNQSNPLNGLSEYDKEMIKRTMLEQEATFRKQVYEMHRLYHRQKELVKEFQKKGLCKNPLQGETSQSNSFSSQIPSDSSSRMQQVPHQLVASTSHDRAPCPGTDDNRSHLNFLNGGTVQSTSVPIEKGAPTTDGDMLDTNLNRVPRRMFDLQLPAEAYIDCEDVERSGKETDTQSSFLSTVSADMNNNARPENDMSLILGVGEDPSCREDRSDSHARNVPSTHNLADLNEPVKEMCFGEAANSVSAHLPGPRAYLEESHGHWLPMRSDTSFPGPQHAFHGDRHNDGGTCSNILHADKEETYQAWAFSKNKSEAGKSRGIMNLISSGSSIEKFQTSSEQIQPKLKKPLENPSSDQNKGEPWFMKKFCHGVDISERSSRQGPTSPLMPRSFSAAPSLDNSSTASSLVSTWAKPVNSNSHVQGAQTLPLFNGAGVQNPRNPSDKWQNNGDLRSQLGIGTGSFCHRNGFNYSGFQLDSSSASQLDPVPVNFGKLNLSSRSDSNSEGGRPQKSSNDVNLNRVLPNGIQDRFTTQKNTVSNEAEGIFDNVSGVLSWLRGKPASNASPQMELDFSQGYPQLKSRCTTELKRRQETEESSSLFDLRDLPSSSQTKDKGIQSNKASDEQTCKRIFGVPILDMNHPSASLLSSHQRQSVTEITKSSEKYVTKATDLETQIHHGALVTENCSGSLRNDINLNSDPKLLEISAKGDIVMVPSHASASSVAYQIDLEAPVTSWEDNSDETVVRQAAENILRMSSDKSIDLTETTCCPLPTVPTGTLHWFAEVASSSAGSAKESLDEVLDLFELMTLKMEETKPDEYWMQPSKPEDQKDEEDGKSVAASLLFTKPRRGQARKRRQRRDFQKDILPGLVSLSRHEVMEDLQTLGGLMKALGQPWQAGGTRRNSGRNGTNTGTRGRRRPRSLAIAVEEIRVSPPPLPQPAVEPQPTTNTEAEADGKNMIGWGRTTRRCRRQRFPPVSVPATLT